MHREDIFNAAKVTFAEKGFEKATMEEIAKRAEFAKGTIYLYFKNKDDLFISLIENHLAKSVAIINKVVETKKTPVEKVEALVFQTLSFLNENKEFIRIFSPEHGEFMNKMQNKTLRNRILSKLQGQIELVAQVIKEGIDANVFKDINPYVCANALEGMIHTIIANWVIYEKEVSKDEAKIILDIFLNGIKK